MREERLGAFSNQLFGKGSKKSGVLSEIFWGVWGVSSFWFEVLFFLMQQRFSFESRVLCLVGMKSPFCVCFVF